MTKTHTTPIHILRDSKKATNWKFIVEIIQQGRHPSDRALSIALSGSKPIPRIVRNYLADRFLDGWPKGGRVKTPWEKMETVGLKWKAIDGDIPESLEQIIDAALEVQYRWLYHRFCKALCKTHGWQNLSRAEEWKNLINTDSWNDVIENAFSRKRQMPPGWVELTKQDYDELILFFMETEVDRIEEYATFKFEDVVTEVSEEQGVNLNRLADFFRVGAQRFDFR